MDLCSSPMGSIDNSVLYEQDKHVSTDIWIGKGHEVLKLHAHTKKVEEWFKKLTEKQIMLVEKAGFLHLSSIPAMCLDAPLLSALVERWRRETNTFHMRVGEMTITLKDVALILGLAVDGEPVIGYTYATCETICQKLLGKSPSPDHTSGGMVKLSWLRECFIECAEDAHEEDVMRHTRAFLLYLLGCTIFSTTSGNKVPVMYLQLLEDFDGIKNFAWGAAALSYLYRALGNASLKGQSNICGSLTLLQCWSYEHLNVGRPGLCEVHDRFPLAWRWERKQNLQKHDIEFYRNALDSLQLSDVSFLPYIDMHHAIIPQEIRSKMIVGRCTTMLICFDKAERHLPNRCLRQYGLEQSIPEDVKSWKRKSRGTSDNVNLFRKMESELREWGWRRKHIIQGNAHVNESEYMDWYMRITRKFIGRPLSMRDTLKEIAVITDALSIEGLDSQQVQSVLKIKEIAHEFMYNRAELATTRQSELSERVGGTTHERNMKSHIGGAMHASNEEVHVGVTPRIMIEDQQLQVEVEPRDEEGQVGGEIEARNEEQVKVASVTENSSESSVQIPLSWPANGKLTLEWLQDMMTAFVSSSWDRHPSDFPSVMPVYVFDNLVDSASNILHKEPNCVIIDCCGEDSSVVVVGDIHGQLHDLIFLLRDAGLPSENRFFVFNGDYVDRGAWGLETFLVVLAWKVLMPHKVYLLRGNHESEDCTSVYGFKKEVMTKFGDQGEHVYHKCLECFKELPLASVIAGRVYTTHGGLFRSIPAAPLRRSRRKKKQKLLSNFDTGSLSLGSLEELSKARRFILNPPWDGLNLIPGDVLWSDPSMDSGLSPNKERGMGLLWGPDCTEEFLKKSHLKLIIRSHEGPDARENRPSLANMEQGYTIDHVGESGKLITLFSAPDYPQFQKGGSRYNNKGAYAVLEPPDFDNPIFHTFEAVSRPEANPYEDYKDVRDLDEEQDLALMGLLSGATAKVSGSKTRVRIFESDSGQFVQKRQRLGPDQAHPSQDLAWRDQHWASTNGTSSAQQSYIAGTSSEVDLGEQEIPGFPSWSVSLPDDAGGTQLVRVEETTEVEGFPLAANIQQDPCKALESSFKLIASLKAMLHKSYMRNYELDTCNKQSRDRECKLMNRIAELERVHGAGASRVGSRATSATGSSMPPVGLESRSKDTKGEEHQLRPTRRRAPRVPSKARVRKGVLSREKESSKPGE